MLDSARTPQQKCNQRDAAPAHSRCQVPSGRRWCVLASKPHAERRAHAALHLKGYQPYLPLITVRWRDRTWHTAPLFPGYVFCRLDLSKPWHPVTRTPGVFQLLMINGQPATCPDHALEAVQSALQAAEALAASRTRWSVGQPCSLAYGPLRGMPAIITAIDGDQARVAVMMLGQLRVVRIDTEHLRTRDE